MAELDDSNDLQDLPAGAEGEQTEGELEEQTVPDQGKETDQLLDRTGAGPDDPNDPQYKRWMAAYTQSRQRDRERYGKVESEHKQFGEVLRNFYQDDSYALQVLRQRFPQLANQLSLSGGTQGVSPSATPAGPQPSATTRLLEESLGPDLAFLAPRLGPVFEQLVQGLVKANIAPLEHQSQQQQAQARRSTEDKLMAELDRQHPGWEARYGKEMEALDAFLSSDQLEHPVYGNKYQLLLKLANPDTSRVEAVRSINQASRSRLSTGRGGAQSQPDPTDAILKARNRSDAFRLAAEAAIRELGSA